MVKENNNKHWFERCLRVNRALRVTALEGTMLIASSRCYPSFLWGSLRNHNWASFSITRRSGHTTNVDPVSHFFEDCYDEKGIKATKISLKFVNYFRRVLHANVAL